MAANRTTGVKLEKLVFSSNQLVATWPHPQARVWQECDAKAGTAAVGWKSQLLLYTYSLVLLSALSVDERRSHEHDTATVRHVLPAEHPRRTDTQEGHGDKWEDLAAKEMEQN